MGRKCWKRSDLTVADHQKVLEAVRFDIALYNANLEQLKLVAQYHEEQIERLQSSNSSTTSEVSNGQDQEEKTGDPPVRNEAGSA